MSYAINAKGCRRAAKGFTLIELLVVIAIIAILAAILFPVFNMARNRAKAAACTSNLKQISQAFQMYLGDFDGTWPSTSFGAHIFMLEPYVRQIRVTNKDSNKYNPAMKKPAVTVWLCPAAPLDMYYNVQSTWWDHYGITPPWRKYGIQANAVKVFHSYVVNDDVTIAIKSSALRKPSHTVLVAETCYWMDRQGAEDLGTASTAVHPSDGEMTPEGYVKFHEEEEVTGFDNSTKGSWCRCAVRGSKSHIHPRHDGSANFMWADGRVTTQSKVPDYEAWAVLRQKQ